MTEKIKEIESEYNNSLLEILQNEELFKKILKENKFSTGDEKLDHFLKGGYDKDIITTIYGPGGSGKTNFVLMSLKAFIEKEKKIIFIDTESSFSIERLKQLYPDNYKILLEKIILIKVFEFKSQFQAINKITELVKTNDIGLIIIDSISSLYRLVLQENPIKIKNEFSKQLYVLMNITRRYNIPTIITNQVYSLINNEDDNKIEQIKSYTIKNISKCIIELTKNEINDFRFLILKKHRYLKSNSLKFKIVDKGIDIIE